MDNKRKKEDISVNKGPSKPISDPKSKIFTQPEMAQVYVLEPSTSRVLVYNKDQRTGGLTYVSQYVFEDLKDVRDFYVDKASKALYLLGKTKVYRASLPL